MSLRFICVFRQSQLTAFEHVIKGLVFLVTVIVFVLHDYIVNKRQDEVLRVAERTNAIVKSLFPQVSESKPQ